MSSKAQQHALESLRPDTQHALSEDQLHRWVDDISSRADADGATDSINMRDPDVRAMLEKAAGERIAQVSPETMEQLRQTLAAGVANCETYEQMKARVAAVIDDSK